MAKTVINPEAELTARERDTSLSDDQLESLALFESLKKQPSFIKYPGTWVLRHYKAGESICIQGESGGTAYYLLTRADVETLAGGTAADSADKTPPPPVDETFRQLLEEVRGSLQAAANQTPGKLLQLASARLMVDTSRRGLTHPVRFLQSLWRRPSAVPDAMTTPSSIPNDGPVDIDYKTQQAPMYEGEVFGEMSCMSRQPRSATVVATVDCFVLEFLRNMLEQLQKDKDYNDLMEKKYRERVLELHLERLSIFQLLSADVVKSLKDKVELVKRAPGTVLWDEGDASEDMYVVRTGMVQVVQSFPWRMTESAVRDWPKLWALLGEPKPQPAVEPLRKVLSKTVIDASARSLSLEEEKKALDASEKELKQNKAASEKNEKDPKFDRAELEKNKQELAEKIADLAKKKEELAAKKKELEPHKKALLDELNLLAKTNTLITAKETKEAREDRHYARERAGYPKSEKKWTGLQIRRANRVLYQVLFGDAVSPADPPGTARVLDYVGRGGIVGEIGVVREQLRSATCMAFSHADADRDATDVELVRVPKEVAKTILADERLRVRINKLIDDRLKNSAKPAETTIGPTVESRRAQELGLLQGQNMMLIDLDRCTRCGDCVQACINTHDDGHSRLFLDGPQFGKYLIPSSCRQCRDPVCMIGCPVGSIQQGPDREIRIREWCIGCGLCADQCPYDSIQMHDAASVPSRAPGWRWMDDSNGAMGANWYAPAFSDGKWRVATTPFSWGIDFHRACSGETNGKPTNVKRLYFRYRFRARPNANTRRLIRHQLKIVSAGESLEVYLNGEPVTLSQDDKQKKRSEFTAVLEDAKLRNGEKVLAISLGPPKEFGATLLDVRIDTLAPEFEKVEEKIVEQRAVVCDQCSSLSGDRQACVYACPHEAAMRVNSWVNFPQA